MKISLHPKAMTVVDNYLNIRVDSWRVRCPYFINMKKERLSRPVWAGKGFPDEIERTAKEILKKNSLIRLRSFSDEKLFKQWDRKFPQHH